MDLVVGTVLQRRYEVREVLGRGGSATTYAAHDRDLDRDVALKVLADSAPELIAALALELNRLRGLWHPHLARVLDLGSDVIEGQRRWFLASERIVGTTLDATARARDFAAVELAVCDALDALGFLHRIGTRHGDVKPENILVTPEGRGVLIDLGCARSLSTAIDLSPSGTPAFMAPEVLRGDAVDERADLFSLGKSLLSLHLKLPSAVQKLLQRMCAPEAADRPANVNETLELLGHARPTLSTSSARSPQLIERDTERTRFEQLLDLLMTAQQGPRAVHVHGPPGIGRTRLLDEFKWAAQLRCMVAVVHARQPNALIDGLTRATGRDEHPNSLQALLTLRDQWPKEPSVVIVDDAQLLSERELQWLIGLLRTTTDGGSLLIVAASEKPFDHQQNPHVATMELAPLTHAGLGQWAGAFVSAAAIPGLARITGGFPSYVQLTLDQLSAGTLTEVDVIAGDARALDVRLNLTGFSEDELSAVAMLCADSFVPDLRLTVAARAAMQSCVRRGLVCAVDGGFALVRAADSEALSKSLPSALAIEAHRNAALALSTANTPAQQATRILHLVRSNDIATARAELIAAIDDAMPSPRLWLNAALALAERAPEHDVLLATAHVARAAGEPRRVLSLVARALRQRPSADQAFDARCLAADAYSQLGDHRCALTQLTRTPSDASDQQRAVVAERRARIRLQQGEYVDAQSIATTALTFNADAPDRARLYETLGVACTYLGQRDEAMHALAESERLHAADDLRARFRCLSYRAMAELRAGHANEAAQGYGQALRLAEAHGMPDLYVNAALNVGSVAHPLGDWGPILESYERAVTLAQALGKQNTLASLQFNLANLYADIGAFDRADRMLHNCQHRVVTFNIQVLRPYLARLRAEIDAATDRHGSAKDGYAAARVAFESNGAHREVTEIHIELASLALSVGEPDACETQLNLAERALSVADVDDLVARARLVRGRLLSATQRAAEALAVLESALHFSRQHQHRLLTVDVLLALADACTALQLVDAAQAHRTAASQVCARVAVTLPASMRDTFYAHPKRRALLKTPPQPASVITDTTAQVTSGFDLSGFLEINRRINSSLSVDQVLSHAMDAAIALTGAERGFLLLANAAQEMEVSVARNVDREHLGKAHMKFSHSIAEQVMQSEEPLLTIDAGSDSRFASQQSVHSMKLKSVVCVPIRSPLGVLGALYLDNRFQRARFRQEDVDVLMAFSDQVAIAITNARLHAQLEHRTRELDAERKRVEKLARGQAIEIGRLQGALQQQQRVMELRHDYSSIVSRSAGMRELLATLDRVTDSNLSVLIQGESGTGKEVIARAIHFNGPRRKEAFVSINCGALPEPLLESELFGHVKGAFTGADRDRAGLFVAARNGTLLLDEVGEMPASMQVKLLRVLQEREVRRVGSSRTEAVDVRVLCATNRNLQAEVSAGRFREDLYYRLAVVELTLPPLRERQADITELARALLHNLCESAQREVPVIQQDALRALQSYAWPGNVRELENVLSRALVMCEGTEILAQDLTLSPRRHRPKARDRKGFEDAEAALLLATLSSNRWNVSAVARQLGIPRNTLYRKLQKYDLERERDA